MSVTKQEIQVQFGELPQLEQLERDWLELETRSESSFFTSWSWIGCWLACLPDKIQPKLLRATVGEKTVGMGLLLLRHSFRHRVIPVKSLSLHATGDPYFDDLFIEYNGFLVDQSLQSMVVSQMLEFLVFQCEVWDELRFDGLTEASGFIFTDSRELKVQRQQYIYRYVDLDEVRLAGGDYLSLLGYSTRYNIRRSIKEFAKQGHVSLTVAKCTDEAMEYLAGLKQLHQAYWQSRGLPGAFANTFFDAFHNRLIRARFDSGEIQLIRVSAGDSAVGYLYNFIHRGLVHNYQTGFDYTICKRQYSPGLMTHSLAIEHNVSQGHLIYDLMAGDSQYKQALGTCSGEMNWIVLQRDRFKFRLEDGLRKIKRWVKSFYGPNAGKETT